MDSQSTSDFCFLRGRGVGMREQERCIPSASLVGSTFTSSRRSCCQRKPNLKTRIAWFRIHLDIAAVLLHNPLHRVEAQASAFTNSFGRKERLEDVRSNLGRDPGTVIANFDYHATVVTICPNPQFALAAHGIDGVIDQI